MKVKTAYKTFDEQLAAADKSAKVLFRQHAVLDTAVDVDGADVPEDADADSVISGPVPDGDGVIREGDLVRRISTEAVRLIRHLRPAPVSLLIFPEAESTSFF